MQKVFTVAVDIGRKLPAPAFEVNTNDLKSVKLLITITNGQTLLDLTDTTVRIAIRKPDNNILFQDCTINDAKAGQVEIVLENQAYIMAGTHTAEIMCYKGNEVVAVTGTFSYKSTKGIMNDEAVESRSEFTTITGMLKDVQDTIKDVRENGTGIDTKARQDIQSVTTQLAEKVGGGNLAGMGDLDQDVKTAMTGGSVAIVGPGAVTEVNLANDMKAILNDLKIGQNFGDFKVLSNADIVNNTSDFSFASGNLTSNAVPADTYKWVVFTDTLTIIEYTVPSYAENRDAWFVLAHSPTNAIGVSVASVSNAVGWTRNFSKTGRTDITSGDSARDSAKAGDVIKVTREGLNYHFTIKRSGTVDFVEWFTVSLTTSVSTGFTLGFGFLSGSAAKGAIANSVQLNTLVSLKNIVSTLLEQENETETGANSKTVDLIMFMGQSNMAGRGTASEAPLVPANQGFEFRAITDPNRLYNIVEPFGKNENNPTSGINESGKTGSMVSAFAIEYYKKTNVPIVGVSCSKGGTSINFWQPNGAPLNDAITRFRLAETWLKNNGYTIRHKYILWCQGETDGDNAMPIAEYKMKLETMVNAMAEEGIEKCFLVRIGNHRDNATLYNPIIQAQTEIAKVNDKIVLVSTKFDKMASEGLMKDLFHYTQSGYNIVGTEAGRNTAFYVNNEKEPTLYDWEYQNLYYSFK